MDVRYFALFFVILVFFPVNVAAGSVGAVPGNLDFGQVEAGETIDQQVYVRTNLNQNFTINPSVSSDTSLTLFRSQRNNTDLISEQGSSSWFTVEDRLRIDPTNDFLAELEGGETRVNGVFDVELTVPDNAEPGLHYGYIRLNADLSDDDGPAGTINFAETRLRYSIFVQGSPERNVRARDIRGFRLDEGEAAIEVLLSNEGTVTTSVEDFDVNVLDSNREKVSELQVSGTELEPDESVWVETRWREESIDEGVYQVDGELNYLTGSSYASGSFSLPEFDVIEVRPDDSPSVDSEEDSLPIWLVLMVLVVLGVLMWSFEIDPVWIFGIVGVLGISAFILMSNVSNLLLVGVLIPALLIVYLGV